MKAVILVGGQATRLLPLTNTTPKALVPVVNLPFLEHTIRHLKGHRIKDIVLALGHLSRPITEYLGDGRRLGVRLSYVVEDTPLGTAGAIKNAERYLDETFLVLNGDCFTDLDITAMVTRHQERRARVTIALTPVADPTSYGLVESDAEGRVSRFLEKPEPSQITTNTINAGIYVLEPEVLAQVPPHTSVSIEREIFPRLLEQGQPVYAYLSPGYWIDIGTPEKYLQLHRDLLRGKSRQYAPPPGEVVIGKQSQVHPTARIKGPVAIGDGCTIGRETIIEEAVIWRNVRLGERVHLRRSIVADGCRLGDGSSIEDSVLGDNVTVASGLKLGPGSKIWPGTAVTSAGEKS